MFNSVNSSVGNFDYFIQRDKGCLCMDQHFIKYQKPCFGSIPEGKQVQPRALLLFQTLLCTCLLADRHEIIPSIHMLNKEEQ
jgi:hypothetical protein